MRSALLLVILLYSCGSPTRETDIGISVTLLGGGEYSVLYDGNGATNGLAPIDINSYSRGDTILIMDGSGLSRDGVTLTRWNLSPDGSGESYHFGQELLAPGGDIYLYGEW